MVNSTEKKLRKFLNLGVNCNKKAQDYLEKWFKELKEDDKRIKETMHILLEDINPHVKLVKICWKDANTNRDGIWMREVIKQKLLPAETIGYLLYEDEEKVVIGGFWFWDEESDILDEKGESVFRDVHTIPKSLINKILILKIDFEATKKYEGDEK